MPMIEAGDLRVCCEETGPEGAPPVVLSHSLGMDLSMWDPQAVPLSTRFRVLRYDTRGHGRTAATAGSYTIEQLARDVLRLMDALGLGRAHFCGLSLGGMIGMWLGAHAPERVHRLVLCNTGARIGTTERWNERIASVRQGGTASVAAPVLERWFSPAFRERSPGVVGRARAVLTATPSEGYAGCSAAIRDADLGGDLASIRAPTLVIGGSEDPATPPADNRRLAETIPNARYVELRASHLSCLEAAEEFTAAVAGFLSQEGEAGRG
jgi:3-oxoadipate enol-lactonase